MGIRSDIDVLDIIYTVCSTWMSVCDWRQEGNRGPMWQDLKDVWSSLDGGNQSGCTSILKEFLEVFSDVCSQMLSEIDIFNFIYIQALGCTWQLWWLLWTLKQVTPQAKIGVAGFRPAKPARAGVGSLIKFLIIWSPVLTIRWVCSWLLAGNLFGFGC